jgi:nucleoside-diphosphate-sugar epimerase
MAKTILLTGSSGTVGTALAMELINRGYDIIPLDIKHSLWDEEIDRKTVFHDLRQPIHRQILRRRKKPDMIIHLAANARVHDLVVRPRLARDNYLMTYNLLEYARQEKITRILFSSSREVYGESRVGERRKEDDTTLIKIKSPYTASKFGSEALLHAYHECYGIKPVLVRLSNVYGRYDVSERVIPLFIYYAVRNRDLIIFGKEKKLDFTYIDDCVDGLIRIIKRFDRVAGLTFNLSRGVGERIIELAKMIVSHLDSRSKIRIGTKRVGEISSFVGDISLARKMLGYSPKVTLKDGLPKNIEWQLKATRSEAMRVYQRQRRNLLRYS